MYLFHILYFLAMMLPFYFLIYEFDSPSGFKTIYTVFFRTDEFEHISVDISKTLEILGFLDIADVASPPMLSRHLVLPMSTKNIKKMEGM